ncbi:sodium:proton antiporter [Caenispirillum salinarum]|uniref:sodium:proton antiporter n=1 Tax=Caenispirillum salinarum TaxID=859058 RepID=UPI00384DA9E8
MDQAVLYMLTGGFLFAAGLAGVFMRRDMVIRVIGASIMASGTFLVLVAAVPKGGDGRADPVAQALVLTGIVISVSLSGFGLALVRRLREETVGRREERSEAEAHVTSPAEREQ